MAVVRHDVQVEAVEILPLLGTGRRGEQCDVMPAVPLRASPRREARRDARQMPQERA